MPGYFLDTSAAAKLYHQEAGSATVTQLVDGTKDPCYIARLALVEMEAVCATKVRTGALSLADSALALIRFRTDLARGLLILGPTLDDNLLAEAAFLIQSHGVTHRLRSLDALQLATALQLHRAGKISVILASDHRLCAAAQACGCTALDPAATPTTP